MFKFLRKYNKLILAVGGVLLMITFLIPQAIQRLSQEAGASRATVATVGNGEAVSGPDLDQVRQEVLFMQRVGIGVPGLSESVDQLKPEHWYLLVREAKAAGLMGTPASVQLSDEVINTLQMRSEQRNPDFVRTVLAKITGVGEMIKLYQTGGLYSDRRMQNKAERLLYMVNAQIVVLRGDKDRSKMTPTEDEITAQMNKFADKLPGEGENGFGYKLPDRVKLEWLSVPADSVRKVVETSDDFSTLKQRMHWRKNEGGAFPVVNPDLAIPEVVKTDLLDKLTKQKLDDITRDASAQLRLNRRGLLEKDGFVVLSPEWQQQKMSFQALATTLQDKYKIELPAYEARGDRWTPVSELGKLKGIGGATCDAFGSQRITLADLVAAAKELRANPIYQIQQDIAAPPLRGMDGSLYLFRIIGADPSRKPNSVEEVREAVVGDLKRESHYKQLVAEADQLKQQAQLMGMVKFAIDRQTMMQQVPVYVANLMQVKMQMDSQRSLGAVKPSSLPVIGPDRTVIDKILDYAISLPKDNRIDLLPDEQRMMVIPVPEKLAVVVLKFSGENRLTREDFVEMAQKNAIQNLIASEEPNRKESVEDAFGYDALVKRNHFAYQGQTVDETAAEAGKAKNVPVNSAANAG